MRFDRKAFNHGVIDVLTLRPLRKALKAIWRRLLEKGAKERKPR